jgi:hypothetical protein
MNWIQDRMKSLQWSIKFTQKALAAQLGLLLFNIAGIVWNAWWWYKEPNFGLGFGCGAFTANTLWTACMCAKYYGDIKGEKHELKFINELDLKEKLHEDREYYQKARKTYEDFFTRQDVVGGDQPSESKGAGIVCSQADVQNCH